MNKRQKSQFIFGSRWINRQRIVRSMEAFQDLIVILLCVGLFCVMVLQLLEIFHSLVQPVDFPKTTAHILFVLILVELFRLLIMYLQEHSVAVGVAVEIAIVSVLREVIVHGVLEVTWSQILAICGLLFILGTLLLVCSRTPHMDHLSSLHERHDLRESEEAANYGPHSAHYDHKV